MWTIKIIVLFSCLDETFAAQMFPMNQALLKQSGTLNYFGPYLAVDEKLETFAVAEASDDFVEWKNLAWWIADLGHRHRILAVIVATTNHPYYSAYLQMFSVDLLANSITYDPKIPGAYQCGKWDSKFRYKKGQRFAFRCSLYYYRRYVLIRRLEAPHTWQSFLAVAEVKVEVEISYARD